MDFYSYQYFINQSEHSNLLRFGLLSGLLVLLLVLILKQYNSREKRKYRDLVILISLVILFQVGMQINKFEVGKTNQDNSSQMVVFLDNMARSQEVSQGDLMVNAKIVKDEMLIKIKEDYYQVNLNSDFSSYKLEETFLINDTINEIKE